MRRLVLLAGGAATLTPASRKVKRAAYDPAPGTGPPSGTGIPECLEPPQSPGIARNLHHRVAREAPQKPLRTGLF